MEKFYDKLSLVSNITNYYKEHQPGRVVMYNGKDGIKFYVIVERTDTRVEESQLKWMKENPYWEQRYQASIPDDAVQPVLKVAMVSNPDMEVDPRKATRQLHADYLKVVDVDKWAEIQREFMTAMVEAARKRTGISN